jgi:hypothetical protein
LYNHHLLIKAGLSYKVQLNENQSISLPEFTTPGAGRGGGYIGIFAINFEKNLDEWRKWQKWRRQFAKFAIILSFQALFSISIDPEQNFDAMAKIEIFAINY